MRSKRRERPFYHLAALMGWLGGLGRENPKTAQWVVTGFLSLLAGGGTAVGISRTGHESAPAVDRQWLVDSFPAYLRPTIRGVVQEENVPVFAKLDTLEEKNREVRRFIVSTASYRVWKAARRRRLEEEARINAEAEGGFAPREVSQAP
jgi:hypothetical protein